MTINEGGREEAEAQPIFNAPPIVLWLVGILLAIHAVIFMLPARVENIITLYGAVSPRLFFAGLRGQVGPEIMLTPLVTHIFLHASWMHVVMNAVWLLAVGSPIARRLGAGQGTPAIPSAIFVLFFIASGISGALVYIFIHPDANSLLVGASGGIFGLLGGAVRFAFRPPWAFPPGRRFAPINDRMVLVWSAVILLLNFLTGPIGGLITPEAGSIAWEAHLGGYLFGLLAFPIFAHAAQPR